MMWWLWAAWAGMNDCESAYRRDAADAAVWGCVYAAARGGERAEAVAFTERALAAGVDGGQPYLTYANLLDLTGDPRRFDALSTAIRRFRDDGDVPGQVKAHLNLATAHRQEGRSDEGRAQLEAAAHIAGEDEPFASMVAIETARWTCQLGGDYSRALGQLLGLEERLGDPNFPTHGKVLIHHTRRCLAERLGREDEAHAHATALSALARAEGNLFLAVVTEDNLLWDQRHAPPPDFDERVQATLDQAREIGHEPTVADLVCLQDLRDVEGDFSACLSANAERADPIAMRAFVLGAERGIERGELDDARVRLERAGVLSKDFDGLEARVELAVAEARLADAEGTGAIAAWSAAMDAVIDIRELQPDALVRRRTVSTWSSVFETLADRLREAGRVEEAVEVVERLRGYGVVERFDRANAGLSSEDDGWAHRQALLTEIDGLLASGEAPGRLAALEREEAALRERLLAGAPAFARLRRRAVDLGAVRALLEGDEALVVPVFGQRPWAAVVRADGVTAHDLPELETWRGRIEPLSAFVRSNEPVAEEGLAALSAALLGPMREVLSEVEHVTVVAGPELQAVPWGRLPFAGQRLDSVVSIAFSPSLRAWELVRKRSTAVDGQTVVVSDPSLPDVLAQMAGNTRLPGAVVEGASVAAHAPASVRAMSGESASEEAFRSALEGPLRLVHISAHAVLDGTDPERSAVLMGQTEGMDGRLQVREIVGLELDGAVVVLAACRGADGEAGPEGVTGLAEAFLHAGARAVVASRAPLSDQTGRAVFTQLDERLASGERLDRAVAAASGRFAEAAELRVIGDGSVRIPGRMPRRWGLWAVLVGGLLTAAAGWGWTRWR